MLLAANKPHNSEDAIAMTATHFYKVERGETLASIASKLGLSEDKLAKTNRMKSTSRLRTGQILRY